MMLDALMLFIYPDHHLPPIIVYLYLYKYLSYKVLQVFPSEFVSQSLLADL